MKRTGAVPSTVPSATTRHTVATDSFALPIDWSPEQAVAVFETLDDLRELVWARYGLQIQQLLRAQQCTVATTAAHNIDDADVPF